MKNDFITEISEEDFRKLDLIGYRNTRVNCDEHSYRMIMAPVRLNEILDKELELSEEPVENVVFAIHIEPTEEAIRENMKLFTFDGKGGRRNYTYEEAKEFSFFEFSYLDKFMNRFSGNQTFQFGTNMPHIYSNRDYYYIKDDYWRVKKSETKAIYIVHIKQGEK